MTFCRRFLTFSAKSRTVHPKKDAPPCFFKGFIFMKKKNQLTCKRCDSDLIGHRGLRQSAISVFGVCGEGARAAGTDVHSTGPDALAVYILVCDV